VLSVTHCVVAPVFHKYEARPAGAHHCVELPEQTELLPVIRQLGSGFTVNALLHELVQPLLLVVVTVYVPAAFTVIHCVVAPVLHKYEVRPAGAHHCVEFPEHTELLPVIKQLGRGFTVNALLHELVQPLPSVVVTV
jgi:hypothetical protein